MNDWIWKVRLYYNDSAKKPKVPGALAIETVHKSDASKDAELDAARMRNDIGRVEVIPISRRI